jgi:hypothetical protein
LAEGLLSEMLGVPSAKRLSKIEMSPSVTHVILDRIERCEQPFNSLVATARIGRHQCVTAVA